MRPSWRSIIAALFLLIVAAAGLYNRYRPDFPNAMSVVPLPDLAITISPGVPIDIAPYQWRDIHRIIVAKKAAPFSGYRVRGPLTPVYSTVDITRKDPFRSALPMADLPASCLSGFLISPDGDRLLTNAPAGRLAAISLTGKPAVTSRHRLLEFSTQGGKPFTPGTSAPPVSVAVQPPSVWWKRDGAGWYEAVGTSKRLSLWFVPIAASARDQKLGEISIEDLNNWRAIGLDAAGRLLVDGMDGAYQRCLRSYDLSGSYSNLPLPQNRYMLVQSIVLSPDGKSIAYVLLNRRFSQVAYEIGESRRDGSEFRILSSSRPMRSADAPGSTPQEFQIDNSLAWRPDSKAVSMIYDDKLYVLAAN